MRGKFNEGAGAGRRLGPRSCRVPAGVKNAWPFSGVFGWTRYADGIALFVFAAGACFLYGYGQQRVLGILMVLVAGVMAILHEYRFWNQVRPVPPEFIFYSVWVLWAAGTGLLVAADFGMYWTGLRVLIQVFGMTWTAYAVMSRIRNVDVILLGLMLGGVVQIAAVAFGVDAGNATGAGASRGVERTEGLSSNPNGLAFLMIWFVLGCLYLWKVRFLFGKLRIPVLVSGILVAGSVMLATGSRKALVAMLVMLYLWFVFALPKGKGLQPALVGAVIGVFAGIGSWMVGFELLSDSTVGKRFENFIELGGGSVAAAAEENIRYEMYLEGAKMFVHHPIFGVGLNNFGVYFRTGQYSHSNYLEPLATTGLIGFLLYMPFYVLVPLRAWRLLRVVANEDARYRLKIIVIGAAAIGILGFGVPFYTSIPVYLLLTAFSVATWQIQRRLEAAGIAVVPRARGRRKPLTVRANS